MKVQLKGYSTYCTKHNFLHHCITDKDRYIHVVTVIYTTWSKMLIGRGERKKRNINVYIFLCAKILNTNLDHVWVLCHSMGSFQHSQGDKNIQNNRNHLQSQGITSQNTQILTMSPVVSTLVYISTKVVSICSRSFRNSTVL
jgi:hypothetical protein